MRARRVRFWSEGEEERDMENGNGKADHALGRVFAAFARVGATLELTRDLDDLLRAVVREVAALVGVERCSIHLRDEQAGLFRGAVGQGGDRDIDKYVKRSLAGIPADGVTLELLRTKQPVIVANARTDPRIIRASARFWNIHSMMAVPMIFEDEVIGVIYLDDCERPHVFTPELRSKLDAAERQVHALRRAAAVEERLSDLMLAGSGLADIVQMLANVLGKPCAIYDGEQMRVALAGAPDDPDGMLPRLLEPPAVDEPAVAEALASGGDGRPFLVPPMPDIGVMHRHLVAPVVVDDELWGRLVVMECRTRFAGGDMLTLRRAATLVALHMRTERSAIEADWNAGASLAAEILDSGADPSVVGHRAARLGVKLDSPHVVVLIGGREQSATVSDFRAVTAAFREVAPALTVHATKVADGVAAVVEVPDGIDDRASGESAKELLCEVCGRRGGTDRIAAGISSVRSGPGSYADVYLEAQQVLDCIRRFGSEQGPAALSAADLGTGRVFLATSDAEAVRSFADDAFGGMVRDPSKTALLTTLSCFFDNMASIRRCALELNVHENTIRYRLARIEELTGLCVTHDPDAQLGARLSLLVLMTQGRLAGQDGSN